MNTKMYKAVMKVVKLIVGRMSNDIGVNFTLEETQKIIDNLTLDGYEFFSKETKENNILIGCKNFKKEIVVLYKIIPNNDKHDDYKFERII